MIADLHCDTISKLRDYRLGRPGTEDVACVPDLYKNPFHLDLERMIQAGYTMQNFAIYIDSEVDPDVYAAYKDMYGIFRDEMRKNAEYIHPITGYCDIAENQRAGKMSALLTVEEGQVADTIEHLEEIFRDGVRLITLTWNHRNALGCPNCICPDEGLSAYGFDVLARMEALGMMIDVSHLSDRGFYDVCENTKKPFLASHSNARAVTPHVRNLTDDMIRQISERGGIIGVNFETTFLGTQDDCGMAAVVRHLEYMRKTGGEECLALGSDFDGILGNPELTGVQDMKRLWDRLHREGWKQSSLDKLFFGNALRFCRDVLPE